MFVPITIVQNWKVLYAEALHESDHSLLPDRICAAQHQIEFRARELFQLSGDHIEEEQALRDALYALHALQTCLDLHTN
ncbi:MAG TPA: hypothetical protein VLK33_15990 [Terriglobales bacterium]|nr:hypothetical protein [Terriglobales bacterium]